MFLFFGLLGFVDSLSLQCPVVETGPKIDGTLEQLWQNADSTSDFRQFTPYWGQEPSTKTTAYIMRDEQNLYIAFRCQLESEPDVRLTARDGGTGDEVKVYIDTYGSGITGYRFAVSAAGTQSDARISNNGDDYDFSWDGVWRSGVRVDDDIYTVEMAIPFKTLRFGPGPWGVFFTRAAPKQNLTVQYPLMPQNTDFRVSLMSRLDIDPPDVNSLHLELFPVAFVGHSFVSDSTYLWENIGPDLRVQSHGSYAEAGLDATWAPSSSVRLQLTGNPDYAQIEADPFQLNLSKYEIYMPERRPFFIEGSDIFDFPVALLYTRRIGPSFSAGAKVTGSGKQVEWGGLAARTEAYREVWFGDTVEYPSRYFYAARAKTRLFSSSNLGFMAVGSESEQDFDRVGGLDLSLRSTQWEWVSGLSFSDASGKRGSLVTSEFGFSGKHYNAGFDATWSSDSFDVSEIGFYPYSGTQRYKVEAGPKFYPEKGFIMNAAANLELETVKEAGEDFWAWSVEPAIRLTARNGSGMRVATKITRDFEMDSVFWNISPMVGFWSDWRKPVYLAIHGWSSYGYNYNRAYFARQTGGNIVAKYTIRSGLVITEETSLWVENAPDNSVEAITVSVRPKLSWLPTVHTVFSVYGEPAFSAERGAFSESQLQRIVGGAVFSWEFAPKSWFYAVYNHGAEDNGTGSLSTTASGFQLKIKYLFFM